MGTQVTLDRYAGLRAEMESGMLRDEVLARAGLSVDEWTAAQHAWLESMGAEIERDRFELTNSYGRAFLARQRALQAASASRTAVTPALVEAAQPPALPPPAAPLAAPSYVAAMARPPVAEPPVISPPAPAPPPARAKADLNSTAAWDISAVRAALPFAREASAPAAAPPAPPPQDAFANDTQLPGPSPLAAPLPFRPAQPSAPSAPAIPAAKPALPAVAKPNPLLSGTMMSVGPVTATVLPFAASGQGPAAPLPPPPRPAPPPQAQPPAPPVAHPETPIVVGGLTLEQHASLCAEIGFNPARTAETLGRYRVTVEAKTELDRLWKERFATDPAQEARWRTAYRTYFVFLTAPRT